MEQIRAREGAESSNVKAGNCDDHEYDSYLERIQRRFVERTESGTRPLFTTDADADGSLFDVYLAAFPVERRQFQNCSACRLFVHRFGSLVVIAETGSSASAVFAEVDAPDEYKSAVEAVLRRVQHAKVTGVFLSSALTWGLHETGGWRHMAVTPPKPFRHSLLTARQAMAEKRADYGTVTRALEDFSREHVATAVRLLKTDALYRSEKVLGQAEWLADLHAARARASRKAWRDNLLWLAVAEAPSGFCHPRSSMIGTLLEDIAAGMDFDTVSKRFAAKMHPLQYQRPQAAPSAGNVAHAEKIFEKLGLAESLERRFARVDELVAVWRPKERVFEPGSGLFSHLVTKEAQPSTPTLSQPTITLTWEKFARTVLPRAEQIEMLVPKQANFTGLVTAANPDAPPILQWDTEEHRNPVSWYVWVGGSPASQWGLTSGVYAKVNAITLKPSMWHNPERFEHQGKGVVFVIDGMRESRFNSLCLFPEMLKSELHAVRSTIEAYSRSRRLEAVESSACGLLLAGGDKWDSPTIRVTSAGVKVDYQLDRWD